MNKTILTAAIAALYVITVGISAAEAQGKGKAKAGEEGEDEIEIDEPIDDAALIEQQEEGDEDVTDIVGEGREDEEET